MRYELSIENYKGPLEKLLELIEARELEITRVNLAEVTGDFIAYLETLKSAGETDPQLVADFLVVASRLILIKSKALLPTLEVSPEEEEEMADLELRLKIYKQVKLAERHLKALWSSFPRSVNREFLETSEPLFYPPGSVTPEVLAQAAHLVTGELKRLIRPVGSIKAEIIHLKAKIEEVIARLTDAPRQFGDLHRGSRGEIVVLFLAILHLIKEQLVDVDQSANFSEMTVRRTRHKPIVKEGAAA